MTSSARTRRSASTELEEALLDNLQVRLSRVEGHVGGIKRMLADGRDCDDILTQVASVKAAMSEVAVLLLEGHLESCVADAIKTGEQQEAVASFTTSLRRVLRSG